MSLRQPHEDERPEAEFVAHLGEVATQTMLPLHRIGLDLEGGGQVQAYDVDLADLPQLAPLPDPS